MTATAPKTGRRHPSLRQATLPASNRGHRPADWPVGVWVVWVDGGGDWDCAWPTPSPSNWTRPCRNCAGVWRRW